MARTLRWSALKSLLLFENKRRARIFLWVAGCNALIEWLAVCSIYPVVALLTQPDATLQQPWLHKLFLALAGGQVAVFQLLLGGIFLLLFVTANLLNALTYWLHLRYTLGLRHALSLHLLRVYLQKDYLWLLRRHTSDLVKDVLGEVDRVVYDMLAKVSTLVYRGMTALIIVAGLIWLSPLVALSSALLLGLSYRLIYGFFRGRLESLGQRRMECNQLRYRQVQEALSALKEGRLLARREGLHGDYARASLAYLEVESSQRLIGEIPRYLTEILAIFSILLVFLLYGWQSGDPLVALPWVGLYILAIWRLVPALQEVYACWVDVGYAWPAVEQLLPWLSEVPVSAPPAERVQLKEKVALRRVSFAYAEGEQPAVQELNLEVERGTVVALVGRTGSGKTTTADLLGGFLSPTHGCLEVDGEAVVGARLEAWRQNVGIVPQTIYLSDQSVAANIAFAVPAGEIDLERVEQAARLAQIHERIQNLPQQYQTLIGERGLSISGGERQRLGIARALYHRPDLLILDEATSALDVVTEGQLLQAVQALAPQQTLLLVAHRVTSLRDCSRIFVFDQQRLIAQGSFAELEQSCAAFRDLLGTTPDFSGSGPAGG